MDAYALTASIVKSITSLAWPAAIVGSVYIFRDQINKLLPRMRLKYKDVEIDFRLEEAEKKAEALPPPSNEAPEVAPTPEEKDNFTRLAMLSPRAAILEVRVEVEEAVKSVAGTAGVSTSRVQSLLGLTRLLRSRGVIDAPTSALLDDLRVLGNNAAHQGGVDFTFDDAVRYRSVSDRVISALEQVEQAVTAGQS